jgi:hypothetical protein
MRGSVMGAILVGCCVLLAVGGGAPVHAARTRQGVPDDRALRSRLALRLVSSAQVTPAQVVTQTIAPGVVAVAIDFTSGARDARTAPAVSAAQLREWRRSSRRVFTLAARNTRLSLRHTPVETELDEGVLAHVISGDDYAAVQAIDIANLRVCNGREGALVIIPSNDYFACYPIDNSETERALQMLSVVTHGAFREHQRPLTDQVFWVRRGRWMPVPYEMKDDGYDYIGTPEFDRMLARLPELVDQ